MSNVTVQEALKAAIEALKIYSPQAEEYKALEQCKAALAEIAKCEPFGYFKAEPFGWTDCAETDEGAIALYEAPTVQREGWVSVPIELLKDITNCFDNVPSRAHVAVGVDDNLKRIAQWVNSSDGGYGLYQAVNNYLLPAAPTDTE